MKIFVALTILIASGWLAAAQTNEVDLGGVMDSIEQLAQDNLDPDVFTALQDINRKKVEDFLKNYESNLQGDSVLDVARLKPAANIVLPLLESHEETQPYAEWLRARMDYFDAAEELKKLSPPPRPQPGTNLPPILLNPSFAAEQEIWIKKIAPRPLPAGAEKFVPKLKSIFISERVPVELVWLAEVESGFDARARSPSGALGMFQLMPATAKSLGLSLWPFDQRKQLEPSARAAARYLKYLHEKFGSWRLAVAAYNSGEGTVQRLLQRYKTTSYAGIATHLPAETQMYVPKVEATILHREGVSLERLKTPPA